MTSRKMNPEEIFVNLSRAFETAIESFEKEVKSYNKNALARTFLLSLQHPLKQTKKVLGQDELNLLQKALQISECKYNMYINYTINEEPERLLDHLLPENIEKLKEAITSINLKEKESEQ